MIRLVHEKAYEERDEPFRLSSGELSHDYFDGKRALSNADDLRLAAQAVLDLANERGIDFDTVGGLTMGADALAHGIALLSGKSWFTVRKDAKEHGKQQLIEGARVAGSSALLVDDVVTTGGSIEQALEAIVAAGATVQLAVCLVDRSGRAHQLLSSYGVDFAPLCTWKDLGIAPVGDGRVLA